MEATFLCSSTEQLGLGHLARCAALSSGLRHSGWRTRAIGRLSSVPNFLGSQFDEVQNWDLRKIESTDSLLAFFENSRVSAVVMDDSEVDAQLLATLRDSVPVTISCDDRVSGSKLGCDVVWNFLMGASPDSYPDASHLMLGPGYFPLRPSIAGISAREVCSLNNILITMGGADLWKLAGRLRDVVAVIAPSVVTRVRSKSSDGHLEQVRDIASDFQWADAIVCGGGLTKYEAVALCLPTAVVNQTPSEQEDTRHFVDNDLLVCLGDAWETDWDGICQRLDVFLKDEALRKRLAQNCKDFNLTHGTQRICGEIDGLVRERTS